jgi:hypothetical protein
VMWKHLKIYISSSGTAARELFDSHTVEHNTSYRKIWIVQISYRRIISIILTRLRIFPVDGKRQRLL